MRSGAGPRRKRRRMHALLGAFLGTSLAAVSGVERQVTDSIAHPIQTACGARLDPVAFVLGRTEILDVSESELDSILDIGERLSAANRPLGRRWWALAGGGEAAERREVSAGLRQNYRAALAELRQLLGDERWEVTFRPDPRHPRSRCLGRSILAILGG